MFDIHKGADIFEKKLIKFLRTRKTRILIFGIFVVLLFCIYNAPYINLFFNSYLFSLVLIIAAPIILDFDAKPLFILAIFLILFSAMVWIFDIYNAEIIISYAFGFLLSGSISYFLLQ